MNHASVKILVTGVAAMAVLAVCQSVAWTPSAGAAVVRVADSNDPNDPVPGPEMFAVVGLYDDPNDPNDPVPGPEVFAIMGRYDDPNDPNNPPPERT